VDGAEQVVKVAIITKSAIHFRSDGNHFIIAASRKKNGDGFPILQYKNKDSIHVFYYLCSKALARMQTGRTNSSWGSFLPSTGILDSFNNLSDNRFLKIIDFFAAGDAYLQLLQPSVGCARQDNGFPQYPIALHNNGVCFKPCRPFWWCIHFSDFHTRAFWQ
jgi:hypothetical protein